MRVNQMRLQVNHIWGQIGIDRIPGQLSIRQKPAELNITTTPGELVSQGEDFHVQIDSYPCRAEVGLKNNFDQLKEIADRAKVAVLEGIGRVAREGDDLAAINKKGDPLVQHSLNKVLEPPAEFNIAMIPTSRPIIEFVGGKTLAFEAGGVSFNPAPAAVDINYQPGQVSVYVRQQHELEIRFVGANVDILQ
ncbi:MAG TPA: DUF6470 family protein [Bacillota bacterium]|nr:DUF6470 family protein [Bacillota bacterium]